MNRLKSLVFIVVLVMIGATAGMLAHAKSNQHLGLAGVKTTSPSAGTLNCVVLLPAEVPAFHSVPVTTAEIVTNMLPRDTSYGQRLYTGDDGFQMLANVVLMGSSRESIHKPQICLTAQGWNIDDEASSVKTIHLDKPAPYDLPVMRLITTRQGQLHGQTVSQRGLYVYWFVDADRCTASHARRMLWTVHDMVFRSVLDRWAYVSFFAVCPPGQEEATFDRMKKLIVASVPEFQLVPLAAK
jgi:hypothetical protein